MTDALENDRQLPANRRVEAPFAGVKLPWLLLFAVAFFCAYKYATLFTFNSPAPLWFPDSVLLCALLIVPRRQWWLYLLISLPLRIALEAHSGAPLWFVLVAFANDSFKAALSAYAPATIRVWPSSSQHLTPTCHLHRGGSRFGARVVRRHWRSGPEGCGIRVLEFLLRLVPWRCNCGVDHNPHIAILVLQGLARNGCSRDGASRPRHRFCRMSVFHFPAASPQLLSDCFVCSRAVSDLGRHTAGADWHLDRKFGARTCVNDLRG
jgi:hypothetical protein